MPPEKFSGLRFSRLALTGLALTSLCAAPAMAAPAERDPATAQKLTLITPWVVLFGGGALGAATLSATGGQSTAAANAIAATSLALFPLGLSTGYVYAGDPARGMLVSLGQAGIFAGSAGLLAALGGDGFAFAGIVAPVLVGSTTVYMIWVGSDVAQTTERMNRQRLMKRN